ncbi:MAG: branched-chain amino acid ABC transporter permease [Alphaproteobacteria bacterium]|nr:branched-chain amino acid ABC transporter permease [Alphaproteobacteria bacterium]
MLSFISLGVWLTFAIGRINIAQGGFAMIGGYTTAVLMSHFDISFWVCLPLSGIIAAALGALIGWPVLRLKGVYFAMITLCLTEAVRLSFLNARFLTRGASGMVDLPLPGELSIVGLTLIPAFLPGERLPFYYLAAVLLCLGVGLLWMIMSCRLGGIFRSLQQNEDLASSVGINVAYYRVVAFAICCFYGGIGGSFFTAFQQNIYPSSYQVIDSVYFMMYCFIGGLDNPFGPILGAFALIISFELLHEFQRYQTVIFGLVMIGSIMFLPNGLLSISTPITRLWTRFSKKADG